MSGAFRPEQRVRCVRRDSGRDAVAAVGDVLTVHSCQPGSPFFLDEHGCGWVANNFIPADQPGPWTDHDGGACPVRPDVRVEVRLRNGFEPPPCPASEKRWTNWNCQADIVRYRLAADPPEAAAETEAAHPQEDDRLARGIAAIKAEVEQWHGHGDEHATARLGGLMFALRCFGVRTELHPPQPARVEFTESTP